jgi:heat-inducible transcriptional repressor
LLDGSGAVWRAGLVTGTVGVLGPIRMAYGRSISTVRFVAGLLSDLVVELHAE